MQRIYLPELTTTNFKYILTNKDLIHQFIKVLRLNVGEKVIFFNGSDNYDYLYEIKQINKKDIVLEQVGSKLNDSEIDFSLNLYQSIPNKLDKIEYIIQKGVEVGIKNFVFFKSERSQKLIISDNKIERLKKIIIEAVEQSARNYIPELLFLDKLDYPLFDKDENIFFHTESQESIGIKDLEIDYKKYINLFVGPEGGFSNKEVELFKNNGFKKVHLGNRILRTETTGVVSSFYIIQNK